MFAQEKTGMNSLWLNLGYQLQECF